MPMPLFNLHDHLHHSNALAFFFLVADLFSILVKTDCRVCWLQNLAMTFVEMIVQSKSTEQWPEDGAYPALMLLHHCR